MNIESAIKIIGKVITFGDWHKMLICSGGPEMIGQGVTFMLERSPEGVWSEISPVDGIPILLEVAKQMLALAKEEDK